MTTELTAKLAEIKALHKPSGLYAVYENYEGGIEILDEQNRRSWENVNAYDDKSQKEEKAEALVGALNALPFLLSTIAELVEDKSKYEKTNIHNQSDPQGVSNPANGDSSQGASSDGYAAWLVENGKKQGEGLKYLTMGYAGMFTWTESPYDAIHFCRRLDAEKVSAECEDAWCIVEHWFAINAARGKEKV